MSEGVKKTIFLLVFLSAVLFFVVFLIYCHFFILNLHRGERKGHSEIFTHKFRRFNPITSQSTTSFVRDLTRMDNEDYVLYKDIEKGDYVLISSFKADDYECHGTCSCSHLVENEDTNSRRTAAILPFTRGIIFLASAISSVIAVNIAGDYFNQECSSFMEDKCSPQFVKSEVDECFLKDPKEMTQEEIDEEHEKTKESRKYICTGSCIKALTVPGKEVNCEDMDIMLPFTNPLPSDNFLERHYPDSGLTQRRIVELEFMEGPLDSYCRSLGPDDVKGEKWWWKPEEEDRTKYFNICHGYYTTTGKMENPSVYCMLKVDKEIQKKLKEQEQQKIINPFSYRK